MLTGWSIENRFLRPRGKFRFVEESHDGDAKQVLGQTIPAGGGATGRRAGPDDLCETSLDGALHRRENGALISRP